MRFHSMQMTKKIMLFVCILLPSILIGQTLNCCKTIKDVENTITGYWKIKDSKSKTIYHYWVNNGQGNVEDVITTSGQDTFEEDAQNHSFFYIQSKNNGFEVNYVYKYGCLLYQISYLDTNKMILLTNGEATEYFRFTSVQK